MTLFSSFFFQFSLLIAALLALYYMPLDHAPLKLKHAKAGKHPRMKRTSVKSHAHRHHKRRH